MTCRLTREEALAEIKAANREGDWETVASAEDIRKGDTVERASISPGGTTVIITGTAHRVDSQGDWWSEDGYPMTNFGLPSYTHRVRRAPRPELPTEPGSVIIATEVRGVRGEWRMLLDDDGEWSGPEPIGGWGHHNPDRITAWIEAVVLPVTAAPVTLTEDQVGELWDQECGLGDTILSWATLSPYWKRHITATANTALAQHAAPAESEPIADAAKLIASAAKPIDLGDVREGDRVRLVLVNGDEATITVEGVWSDSIDSPLYSFHPNNIRAAYLLDREEA